MLAIGTCVVIFRDETLTGTIEGYGFTGSEPIYLVALDDKEGKLWIKDRRIYARLIAVHPDNVCSVRVFTNLPSPKELSPV